MLPYPVFLSLEGGGEREKGKKGGGGRWRKVVVNDIQSQ